MCFSEIEVKVFYRMVSYNKLCLNTLEGTNLRRVLIEHIIELELSVVPDYKTCFIR